MPTELSKVGPSSLVLLSQYALNFGLVGIRQNLIRYLILSVLSQESPSSAMSVSDIRKNIAERLGLTELHYPAEYIEPQLGELTKEGAVDTQGVLYSATEQARRQISTDFDRARTIHDVVVKKLLANLEARHPNSEHEKATVVAALYSFLGQVFAIDGERFAQTFLGVDPAESSVLAFPDLRTHLTSAGRVKIRDEDLRRAFIEAVSSELEKSDADWKIFLGTIAQCYRILATLNLAPDINRVEFEQIKSVFADARVYMDTNILLQVLTPDAQFHSSTLTLLKRGQELGLRFYFTGATKREVVRQLKRDENLLKRVPAIPPSLLPKIVDVIEEPFIRAYYRALLEKPNLRWEYFFGRLEEVDDLLSNLYAVEYDPVDLDTELIRKEDFETTVLHVLDLFEQMRNRPKSWEAAEHDAFHLLYISQLQRKSSSPVLFFSADRTLAFLPRRVGVSDMKHFAIYPEQILDLVLPFLRPDAASESAAQVYGDYFSSYFVTAAGQAVPIEALTKLIRPWMEYEGLSTESVTRILRSTYVEKVLNRATPQLGAAAEQTHIIDASLIESLKAEMERQKTLQLTDLYQRLKSEAQSDVERQVQAIEAKHRVKFVRNSKIVEYLGTHGFSNLAEISIGTSLLPEEVSEGVSELASFGFASIHGAPSADVETLRKLILNPKVRVRLSTRGHLLAPDYVMKAN